ncbi:MAG: hypothetical protein COV66_05960 [Nitrospinae bacterium CG11_big_fil_rev_8_21_14_0_20_45_15]|nr:MAG: hypothetical protein COV66_05960 [Nitrospinae bacterium CG11_big_fil_rev_8_21_14_0_20_45_15]
MFPIEPKKILIGFICADFFILALYLLFANHPLLGERVDLGQEGNLPTWYSSFKFTLAAIAALHCYFQGKQTPYNRGWLLVTGLMLLMSIDETGQFHETATRWLMESSGGNNLRDYFLVSKEGGALLWTLIFSPIILLVGGALSVFYYLQFRAHPHLFVAGLVLVGLFALAAGLETMQAKILGAENYLDASSWSQFKIFSTLEEMAELLGATLLLWIHYSFAWLKNNTSPE